MQTIILYQHLDDSMLFYLRWTPDDSERIITKTWLPTPIFHADQYEIAVLEAAVTTEFHNVPHQRKIEFVSEYLRTTQEIPKKHYENIGEFHKGLRDTIKKAQFDTQVKVEKVGELTRWTVQPGISLKLQPELKAMLGLAHVAKLTSKNANRAQTFSGPCDIYKNYRRIFLKSDIIIPTSYVNNTVLPLLTSFPVNHAVETSTATINSPIYHKINCKRLEEVAVAMLDEQGRQITSSAGSAYILLHVRPQQHSANCQC